jgi:hypothetical protein
MPMDAHAARRPILSAAVEEPARVSERQSDQFVGVAEVDRLGSHRTRRRQNHKVGVLAVLLDVGDQATLGEQADGVQRQRERPPRRLLQGTRMAGGKHKDPLRAELHRVGVFATPPSISVRSPI